MSQTKTFCKSIIPESSCTRKETVYTDILIKSRNGGRKIMQSIRIASGPPTRIRQEKQSIKFR